MAKFATIHLDLKVEGIERVDALLQKYPDAVRRAVARAINRTATGVRALAIGDIAARYKLKRAYLRERIRLLRASASGRLEAAVRAPPVRGTLLSRYPFRQMFGAGKTVRRKKSGVRVEIKPGTPKLLRSAFLVPLRRGKQDGAGGFSVALRNEVLGDMDYQGKIGPRNGRAYMVLHSVSVHHAFKYALPRILPAAQDRLNREVEHEIGRALKSPGGAA